MNHIAAAPLGSVGNVQVGPISGKDKINAETLQALSKLFHKKHLLNTKKFIEDSILSNRAPQDRPDLPYREIWDKTINKLIEDQKNGTLEAKTEAALIKIAAAIKEYCKNNGIFTPALKKLPKALRESKSVQKLLGTLFRNINKIEAYASVLPEEEAKNKKKMISIKSGDINSSETFVSNDGSLVDMSSDLPLPGRANTKHYYSESGERDTPGKSTAYVVAAGEILNAADARSRYDDEDVQ